MDKNKAALQLAQSASALGAGILGFGIGTRWGAVLYTYAFAIIIIGALFHIYGMYILQKENAQEKYFGIAKALWISAWICLIALAIIIIYLFFDKQ